MTNLENVIETVKIDKYTFQLYKRVDPINYKNKPFAVVYEKETPKGKWAKSKVIEHYVFGSIEIAEDYISKIYGRIFANLKSEKKRIDEKKEAMKTLKASDFYSIGDIVYNSWGYEQTNVEFYQVIKMTEKTIIVQEIAQDMVPDSMYSHGMAHYVTAIKDQFLAEKKPFTLRVKPLGHLSSPTSYYHFSKWDGGKKYTSCYY